MRFEVLVSAIECTDLRSSAFVIELKHDMIERICARAQEAAIEHTTTLVRLFLKRKKGYDNYEKKHFNSSHPSMALIKIVLTSIAMITMGGLRLLGADAKEIIGERTTISL